MSGQQMSVGPWREIDLVAFTDHGQTFSQPKSAVTFTSPNWVDPAGGDAKQCPHHLILPRIDRAPDERLDVAYSDLDAQGFEDTYLISSTDDGGSLAPAPRISDVPSNTAMLSNSAKGARSQGIPLLALVAAVSLGARRRRRREDDR